MAKERTRRKKDVLMNLSIDLKHSAFVMFSTSYASFSFASCLNRLYRLRLWREVDMSYTPFFGGLPSTCPLFAHYDYNSHLFYLLVDFDNSSLKSTNFLSKYDKILAIVGDDAPERMQQIYNDFYEYAYRDIDPYDLLARERDELRMQILSGVRNVDFFDFLHPVNDRLPDLERYKNGLEAGILPFDDDSYAKPARLEDYHPQEIKFSSPNSKKVRKFSLYDLEETEPSRLLLPLTSWITEEDYQMPRTNAACALAQLRQDKLKEVSEMSQDLLFNIEQHLSQNLELPCNF